MKMLTHQVIIKGYDPSTDETDHLVKWIRCPEGKIFLLLSLLNIETTEIRIIDDMEITEIEEGIDMVVSEDFFDLSLTAEKKSK